MRSFSGCGVDLRSCLGVCKKPSLSSEELPLLSAENIGCRVRTGTHWCLSMGLGLSMSTVLCCVLKLQSKRTDSYTPRGKAWKCQLGHAETTGRLKVSIGSFPATVTLESLIDKQTNKINTQTKKLLATSEGPMDFWFWKLAASFLFLFLFMGNEHLNLNHPQYSCDFIALLGTTYWIYEGK